MVDNLCLLLLDKKLDKKLINMKMAHFSDLLPLHELSGIKATMTLLAMAKRQGMKVAQKLQQSGELKAIPKAEEAEEFANSE